MSYSVILSGKKYKLPTKTLAVGEKLEHFAALPKMYDKKEVTLEQIVQEQFDFIRESIGEEQTAVIVGGGSIYEADIDEITFTVLAIVKAYTEKAVKAQIESQIAPYRSLMADKDIQKAVEAISKTK